MTKTPAGNKRILPIIVAAQFAGTSLWFAGNAIVPDLIRQFNFPASATAHITSAVQFGFITGTLIFAIFTIADRFSPSKVFFMSALLAALANLATLWFAETLTMLLIWRFATGFFLAGIYPVGMKIAADYHEKGLGKALGYLVGALAVGTAFPHLLRGVTAGLNWQVVMAGTTFIALAGGLMILLLVPDGPFRKTAIHMDISAAYDVFRTKKFRAAAFGYFGHMWELYTFWAFIPVILAQYLLINPTIDLYIPWWSFIIIGAGGLSCVIGGYLALFIGSDKTAYAALLLSGICCLLSPLVFNLPVAVLLAFLVFWGMVVVADSPQFSTLVAQAAPAESKGTALTIVNSLGFAITIVSIQSLQWLSNFVSGQFLFLILAIGPLLGLVAMHKSTFSPADS
jgi:MFS family permease